MKTFALVFSSFILATIAHGDVVDPPPLQFDGVVSAYTSEEAQTDDTPFIMANGEHVFDGAVANNCLPFGTKVVINGKEYTVSDRMNRRYDCNHFDLWYADKGEAIEFGRQQQTVRAYASDK